MKDRAEISEAAIERMQELSDLGLNAPEIANHTGFSDSVVRACLGTELCARSARRYLRLMRAKILADNPHHTPQSLAPIFRRLRQ